MGVFTGFIVYLLIYGLTLFTVLPWGHISKGTTEGGTVASAPEDPKLLKKFIITALISMAVWCVVYILIQMEIINFYEIARSMREEDLK